MAASFPKIWTIGTPQTERLFNGVVEITEKIDGSQFNFGKAEDGTPVYRSKGAQQTPGTPDKLFAPVMAWAESIIHKIPDGTMLHGETLRGPHHSTLTYGRAPKNHFMLYGVSVGTKFISDFSVLVNWAIELDCETVPLWGHYELDGLSPERIEEFLSRESSLGGTEPEGFVVKNYAESYLIGGQFIPLLMGKYVTEAFKETHKTSWVTEGDHIEALKKSYRTEARWRKTVQHLRERGELKRAPQDIGPLMKELAEDFLTECEEDVKAKLWNHYKKDFVRTVGGGFPEWYKLQLATGEIE